MKQVIFISYRRSDTSSITGRIYERLRVAFPQFKIFMDTDASYAGENFKEHIQKQLENSALTVAVIGPTWVRLRSGGGFWPFKKKRLFEANDNVRWEIELSFKNGVKIVPVLVENTPTPKRVDLPPSLQQLVELQSCTLNSAEFRRDVEDLVRKLSDALGLSDDGFVETPRLQRVRAERKMRVGCIKHPPLCDFVWKTRDTAEFSGLYVDMCRAVGKAADVEVEFVPVDWADIPDRVFREMGLDLVLSVFQTPERAHVNDFTALFHKVNVVGLVQKTNDRIRSLQDIKDGDGKVAVTKGEAGWEFAVQTLQLPKHRLLVMENYELGATMGLVETGKAELAICDEVTCAEFEASCSSVKRIFHDNPLDTCKNGIMVPPNDNDWRKWVGGEFAKAREVPTIKALEDSILAEPRQLIRRYS